jgi:hypothetical protein
VRQHQQQQTASLLLLLVVLQVHQRGLGSQQQ